MKENETIKKYIENYLNERVHTVAPSTLRSEKSKCKNIIRVFKKTLIIEVTHSQLRQVMSTWHKRFSNKSINEHLTILRAIFDAAYRDGIIDKKPTDGIKNLKASVQEPNPFTKSEISSLRNTECECNSGKNGTLLNILTGVRISELIALTWDDINFTKCELYVRRAKVLATENYKVPKTKGSVRTVELNPFAIKILSEQRLLTERCRKRTLSVLQDDNKSLKKESHRFVLINTKTNRPFSSPKQFQNRFFTPFLKAAGVKHRGPSQLRHTFASQALTAGISKEWIAQQMGHTGTHMIDKHYGRWITEDAPDCSNRICQHMQDAFGEDPIIVEESPKKRDSMPTIGSVVECGLEQDAANDVDVLAQKMRNDPELLIFMAAFKKAMGE